MLPIKVLLRGICVKVDKVQCDGGGIANCHKVHEAVYFAEPRIYVVQGGAVAPNGLDDVVVRDGVRTKTNQSQLSTVRGGKERAILSFVELLDRIDHCLLRSIRIKENETSVSWMLQRFCRD
jgi:hypothetical protein